MCNTERKQTHPNQNEVRKKALQETHHSLLPVTVAVIALPLCKIFYFTTSIKQIFSQFASTKLFYFRNLLKKNGRFIKLSLV